MMSDQMSMADKGCDWLSLCRPTFIPLLVEQHLKGTHKHKTVYIPHLIPDIM